MDLRVENIFSVVSSATGIEKRLMIGKSREDKYIEARWIAMWLCHNYAGFSYSEIMKIFSKKYIVTVIHGIMQVEKRINADEGYKAYIDNMIEKFKVSIPVEGEL